MLNDEKKNLFRLIETWEKENLELAFQLIEGNSNYKKAAEERYLPILKILFNANNLTTLRSAPQLSPNFSKGLCDWIPTAEQVEVLESIPIKYVAFTHEKIEVFPKWICHLHHLTNLNLKNNSITKIPEEIGNLTQLEYLSLEHNEIDDLPASIGNLTKLKRLNCDFNNIQKIPDTIGNLSKLEWLCLEKNKINELPETILGLKSLSWLSIEQTPLGDQHHIHNGMFVRIHEPIIRRILGLEGNV